jgi:hypothetical protein
MLCVLHHVLCCHPQAYTAAGVVMGTYEGFRQLTTGGGSSNGTSN